MTTETAAPAALDLPIAQLTSAWILARAHGHEWATCPYPDTMVWPGARSMEGIAAATAAARGDSPFSGIDAPLLRGAMGPHGPEGIWAVAPDTLVHVTGSGRLAWAVNPDGGVRLEIRRPSPADQIRRAVQAARHAAWVAGEDEDAAVLDTFTDEQGEDETPEVVLVAHTEGDPRYQSATVSATGAYSYRHLVALYGALRPLCGDYGALVALAPLWAGALPDAPSSPDPIGNQQ